MRAGAESRNAYLLHSWLHTLHVVGADNLGGLLSPRAIHDPAIRFSARVPCTFSLFMDKDTPITRRQTLSGLGMGLPRASTKQ